jgi:hypothetical protein
MYKLITAHVSVLAERLNSLDHKNNCYNFVSWSLENGVYTLLLSVQEEFKRTEVPNYVVLNCSVHSILEQLNKLDNHLYNLIIDVQFVEGIAYAIIEQIPKDNNYTATNSSSFETKPWYRRLF